MTPRQQIEEAAEKLAVRITECYDTYLAGAGESSYYGVKEAKADILRFAAELHATGPLKGVTEALEPFAKMGLCRCGLPFHGQHQVWQENPAGAPAGPGFQVFTSDLYRAIDARATLAALKKAGEASP